MVFHSEKYSGCVEHVFIGNKASKLSLGHCISSSKKIH